MEPESMYIYIYEKKWQLLNFIATLLSKINVLTHKH